MKIEPNGWGGDIDEAFAIVYNFSDEDTQS
jgi:hypothetical protein